MTSGEATPPALDGAISLVDNTEPSETVQEPSRHTSVSSPSIITKRLTSSVREELTRRKYAKWQPERLGVRDGEGPGHGRSQSKDQDLLSRGPSRTSAVTGSSEAFNEAIDRQAGNLEALNTIPTQLQTDEDAVQHPRVASELDILYENQRGWFFCGLPFYSHRSLLQIDPPAWVNRDYKPSSVDVTNAQVPDPSWHWLWRSWYVDMSGDVDEEGWQYSFSFGGKFGWHGTHPWFHSYVRRRRWVRLRAKTKSSLARSGERGMGPAHRLNEDYFTIHTRNVPGSRDPSIDMYPDNATGPVSRSSRALPPEQILHEDIEDIPTLMQALRLSMVDRERVEVVKNFLAHGGEELYYLEEKIPEIMSFFVFHTTRWQFLKILETELDSTTVEENNEVQGNEKAEKDNKARQRRRDNLARAVEAVRQRVTGDEVFNLADEGHFVLSRLSSSARSALSSPEPGTGSSRFAEIKGIPEEAEIGQEGHIY